MSLIRPIASFKVRKMVAQGVWLSKLSYLIAVYGGTEEYLLGTLQVMQIQVARLVCNRGSRYSGRKALAEVGWLSVKGLLQYFSLLQAKKTLETETPSYLHRKLVGETTTESRYQTRQRVGGSMSHDKVRLELTRKSWRWRVKGLWAQMPPAIRGISGNMAMFKLELKSWLSKRNPN